MQEGNKVFRPGDTPYARSCAHDALPAAPYVPVPVNTVPALLPRRANNAGHLACTMEPPLGPNYTADGNNDALRTQRARTGTLWRRSSQSIAKTTNVPTFINASATVTVHSMPVMAPGACSSA